MYCIDLIWLLLLILLSAKADHFRGGTITWKPINNNITTGDPVSIVITQTYSWTLSQVGCNSSMIEQQSPPISTGTKAGNGINLMCNDSCSTAGGYIGNEVPIIGYCTDFSTALDLTVSQRSDIVNLTAAAHFTVVFAANGGWKTLALGNSAGWSLSSLIDLRVRLDNGLINTPPVGTCISYISVPLNIQQTIQIPTLDADNDFIRCRFASGLSECVNACPPGSLPSGTTLSSSCTLTITGTTVGDFYLIAIQVEDYMTNTSTTPLSSVPLQFLIYVYAIPSCTLKPLLIADMSSSICQGVQVGVNMTMTLTAINRCGSGQPISDIATLSFPIMIKSALVQNTTNTSLWSMKVTWMPTVNQVGSQVFCAVASDNASVQSDQYCVTFFVGLNSVPLCPGVTIAPTTMLTTMQTSTAFRIATSQRSLQYSTEISTMMEITSVPPSTAQTSTMSISSSSMSSTIKTDNKLQWPLILTLSLLALALALCCLLCCIYYYLCTKDKRRRRRKTKESDHNFQWYQEDKNSRPQLFSGHDQTEKYELAQIKSVTMSSVTRISSQVLATRADSRETIMNERSSEKSAHSSRQSKSCADTPRTNQQVQMSEPLILHEVPQDNLAQSSSDLEETRAMSTIPSRASTGLKTNSVNVTKLRRNSKSSAGSHRTTITVKEQAEDSQSVSSNDSQKTRARRASVVSVNRIRRSTSANQNNSTNQRITTAPFNNKNVNRITVLKLT